MTDLHPMTAQAHIPYCFLLGGHDLEMLTLRDLLLAQGVDFIDHGLTWGARASAYRADIDVTQGRGAWPVAVELENDLPTELSQHIHWIDHHGERAGADQPCSLHQAFDLLELPESAWSRRYQLIAANDIGHIEGMRTLGADNAEMRAIRLADATARGIDEHAWAQARAALSSGQDLMPGLRLVKLPHDHTGLVADLADPLFGGQGNSEYFVMGPGEWSYFGHGERVMELTRQLGGWMGGALPARGYWGQTASETLAEGWRTLLANWKEAQRVEN